MGKSKTAKTTTVVSDAEAAGDSARSAATGAVRRSVSTRAGLKIPAYKVKKIIKRTAPKTRIGKNVDVLLTGLIEYYVIAWYTYAQTIAGEGKLIKATALHQALQAPDQCFSAVLGSGIGGIHTVSRRNEAAGSDDDNDNMSSSSDAEAGGDEEEQQQE